MALVVKNETSMIACAGCDVIGILGSAQLRSLFPYDKNNTPRCAKCKKIVKRFCNVCTTYFTYNKPVKKYHDHRRECEKKRLEEEQQLENGRYSSLDEDSSSEEELTVDAVLDRIADQLQTMDIDKKYDSEEY